MPFKVNHPTLWPNPSFGGSPKAWEEFHLGEPLGEASSAAPLKGWAPWLKRYAGFPAI